MNGVTEFIISILQLCYVVHTKNLCRVTKSLAQNKMHLASSLQLFSHKNKIFVVRKEFVYCAFSALLPYENQLKTEMPNLSGSASHRVYDGTMSASHAVTSPQQFVIPLPHDLVYTCALQKYHE